MSEDLPAVAELGEIGKSHASIVSEIDNTGIGQGKPEVLPKALACLITCMAELRPCKCERYVQFLSLHH